MWWVYIPNNIMIAQLSKEEAILSCHLNVLFLTKRIMFLKYPFLTLYSNNASCLLLILVYILSEIDATSSSILAMEYFDNLTAKFQRFLVRSQLSHLHYVHNILIEIVRIVKVSNSLCFHFLWMWALNGYDLICWECQLMKASYFSQFSANWAVY